MIDGHMKQKLKMLDKIKQKKRISAPKRKKEMVQQAYFNSKFHKKLLVNYICWHSQFK